MTASVRTYTTLRDSIEARLAKLRELANIEGYDTIEEMLEEVACDAVSPAICTHEDCDYM